ncbi:MAG: hypothetical protein OEV21_03505, partial [Thermoplasmata archaeon]|nr:hypothetical protein [Thermoplasmata archaeon]
MPKQLITGLDSEDVAKYVILCGEPERAPKIASLLKNSKEKKRIREYVIFEGTLDDERVTIASTGIGGPS